MEKTLIIDGKQVRFKSTAATPLRFKAQFGRDYFAEIFKLHKFRNIQSDDIGKLELIDFDFFYNIVWVLAKTADTSIPEPLEWLDQFDEFPLMEIFPELQELIMSSLQTGKKK